ncbi:MAG: hypothetical protein Q8S24_05010 [Eubacteriales bacterium]|nr:hypothetical protein [Eubacteriales bacterium]
MYLLEIADYYYDMLKRTGHLSILIFVTVLILNSYYLVSLVAMSLNNKINVMQSGLGVQLSDLNLVKPPGDWYPLINAYMDTTFSDYIKEDVDLLIYYSYGDYKRGSSTIFDPYSQYFNSFFGCYVIRQNESGFYGFKDDGSLDLEAILQIPKYDYDYLVVGSLGLKRNDRITDYTTDSISLADESYYVEFTIETNSLYHQYRQFNLNYLPYGYPHISNGQQDFYPIEMSGKFKITKYNKNITLIYYMFSPNQDMVKSWDV